MVILKPMRIGIIIFIILLGVPGFSEEDGCSTVRMDQAPGCLEGAPVTDQGDLNCYAHAASLMMTCYQRKIRNDKMVVSPEKLWTDIQSLSPEARRSLESAESGRTCNAVQLLKQVGMCDRGVVLEVLKSYVGNLSRKESAPAPQTLTLEEAGKAADRLSSAMKKFMASQSGLPRATACENLSIELRSKGIEGSLAEDLVAILQTQNENAAIQTVNQVLKNHCVSKNAWIPGTSSNDPVCKMVAFGPVENDQKTLQSPEVFKKTLHDLLKRPMAQNSPVGIEYCSGIFFKTSSPNLIINRTFDKNIDYLNTRAAASKNFAPDCRFHASAVIGRERKPDGKCYFIIQNSAGASCNYYKDRSKCSLGKLWVEENELSQNMVRISNF